MRKRTAVGAAFFAAILVAVIAASASGGTSKAITLAVYGDAPYGTSNADTAEFQATPAFIQSVNADSSVQEVVHVGDIHSGKQKCTVAYDQSVFDLWKAFQAPLVYTPGDNEWSDCTKTKELPGSDDAGDPTMPLWQLGQVRSIFFAHPGQTLGQNPMSVISQAQAYSPAHPTDAQFVENVMWERAKTVFVTINVPGGSNNDIDPWYGASSPNAAQAVEMQQRTDADVRWLNAAFKKAKADGAFNVVIVGQADMWDLDGHLPAENHLSNYEPIVQAMAANAKSFKLPVLYLNGDSHVFRSDNPLEQGAACFNESGTCADDAWNQHPYYDVPNFHRIVVHGSTFPLEWLKLSVSSSAAWRYAAYAIDPRATWASATTATSFGPFSWQREIQGS
jgi:hypothetical protein